MKKLLAMVVLSLLLASCISLPPGIGTVRATGVLVAASSTPADCTLTLSRGEGPSTELERRSVTGQFSEQFLVPPFEAAYSLTLACTNGYRNVVVVRRPQDPIARFGTIHL